MVIIMLGDVVGQSGCEAVRALLPGLRRDYRADAVIVNGENSAQGNGILPSSAKHLFDSGANVITTGNHGGSGAGKFTICLRRRRVLSVRRISRPNAPERGCFGSTCCAAASRWSI